MARAAAASPRAAAVSPRAARTRDALVRGAREVFERDGFVDARIVDIAAEAGVATGSFYTYFDDKQAAFAAVLAEVREEMSTPRVSEARSGEDDPVAAIEAANRAYLEVYRRNARLMALMEQVAAIDEEFRRWRLDSSTAVARRNARGIRRLQERGLADPELDADVAAAALGVMVSRMAHLVFTQGHRVSFDTLLAQVTLLWANALGIPTSKGER